jgi:hypothetical protein
VKLRDDVAGNCRLAGIHLALATDPAVPCARQRYHAYRAGYLEGVSRMGQWIASRTPEVAKAIADAILLHRDRTLAALDGKGLQP